MADADPSEAARDDLLRREHAAFAAAFDERRWEDAAKIRLAGLFERAIAAFASEGFDLVASDPISGESVEVSLNFQTLEILARACRQLLKEMGEDAPGLVEIAAECIGALEGLQAVLEGWDSESEEDEGVRLAKLILLGAQVGSLHSLLAQWENGLIDRAARNAWKLHCIGQPQRGRIPSWEEPFHPHAVAFCAGKSAVTLASLGRLAKDWGGTERVAGRNPGLPATDEGIEKGIKRMERRGVLAIPGRPSREAVG